MPLGNLMVYVCNRYANKFLLDHTHIFVRPLGCTVIFYLPFCCNQNSARNVHDGQQLNMHNAQEGVNFFLQFSEDET